MKPYERQLMEMEHWCKRNGAGMEILFAGHHPSYINAIPHAWQVTMGRGPAKEIYHAYGVSMPDAIERCYQRWQASKTGYHWQEDQREPSPPISQKAWLEYQQSKKYGG